MAARARGENLAGSEWTLAALAARARVPARTVRFYIARGLLPGPRKAGRDAAYGPEHLDRLGTIRELQARGLTLAEIGHALADDRSAGRSADPTSWWQYPVEDGVIVWVRSDTAPWRLRRIRKWIHQMAGGPEWPG